MYSLDCIHVSTKNDPTVRAAARLHVFFLLYLHIASFMWTGRRRGANGCYRDLTSAFLLPLYLLPPSATATRRLRQVPRLLPPYGLRAGRCPGLLRPVADDHHHQMSRPSIVIKIILGLLWTITHLAIRFLNLWSHLICCLECYLISSGLLWKYQNLRLGRLKYLGVVVDSKEAKSTAKIQQLLCWLSSMGVKYVCLYDIDGVLKKSLEPAVNAPRDRNAGEHFGIGANIKDLHCSQREMVIDCLSGSDGKEGIAKAANLLCSTYFNGDTHGDGKRKPTFTEADMASALKAVGCGEPEPDLLLIYGSARCHLGFPAWRLRYTEIMYMGPLKSMKYGAIVKTLYNFSKKYQNYGK